MSPFDFIFGAVLTISALTALIQVLQPRPIRKPHYNAVYMKEPGVDLIIIPVEESFARTALWDQRAIEANLQNHASAAGLEGIVVPVCNLGPNGMFFRAPPHLHPFFRSINMAWVIANLNQEIY
jgi:hypothetical protein